MAKGSTKKIAASNTRQLNLILVILIISSLSFNGCLAITRSWTVRLLSAYAITLSLALLFFLWLHQMAAIKKNDKGVVESVGFDLDKPGLHQYMMDYIYIVAFAHFFASFTNYAWCLFLLVSQNLNITLISHLFRFQLLDSINCYLCCPHPVVDKNGSVNFIMR